ncbi:MAG: menaquinone reductase multiheme cytochrome c subunit QrcA [Desulfosudaceae bacterium]
MSEFEDQTRQTSVDGDNNNAGPEEDSSSKASLVVFLSFLVGVGLALLVGWVVFPALLYSEKEQPVQFDHELHMYEVSDGCESCHYFREDGTFSGAPTLNECIDCHEYPMGGSEEELVFVEEYVEKNREVPWLIYSRQPDCVFFSHAAHVKKADMSCRECHGDIESSTRLKTYQENRITGYSRDIWGEDLTGLFKEHTWDSMKMDDCAKCHEEETGSKGACFQCHK